MPRYNNNYEYEDNYYSRGSSRCRNRRYSSYDDEYQDNRMSRRNNNSRRSRKRNRYDYDYDDYDNYRGRNSRNRSNRHGYRDDYDPVSDTGYNSDYFDDTLTGRMVNGINQNTERVKEKRKKKRKKEIITVKDTSIQYDNAELQKEYVNVRTGEKVRFG